LVAASNINRVVLTGNLTTDPELRSLPSGTAVCKLRVASNTRRKNNSTGEWEDKPNYFDVTVWGAQGENCARYLSKGRPVAIDGRLEWREWAEKDQNGNPTGRNRQSIDIIAESVQFLGGRDDAGGGGNFGGGQQSGGFAPRSDVPVDTGDFGPAPVGGGAPTSAPAPAPADDDIPF
jgi:single-strand DNA-binding protein